MDLENGQGSEVEREMEPRVAAVQLLEVFRVLAKGLCPRDRHLQEVLMQEMALGVLQCGSARTAAGYCVIAMWRARDYLRQWNEMSRRPGCERHARETYDPAKVEAVAEAAEAALRKAETAVGEMRNAG